MRRFRRLRGAIAEDGFTLVETTAALAVLAVGILGGMSAFNTARKLSLISERHTAMTQIAQREIERIEGIPYSQIGLASTPSSSIDPSNPNHYVVAGSPPVLEWNRSTLDSEPLDVDSNDGTIQPVQSWSQVTQGGNLSGQIYDYVTWTTDSHCSPGCPAGEDYKRIVVAVTMSTGLEPDPVYVSSFVADPQSAPAGGVVNGSAGNPLVNPASTCANASGQTVSCTQGLDSGSPTTYFLHDWPSNGGTAQTTTSDHTLHRTVGASSSGTCTSSPTQALVASNITGCPQPDLMDSTPPSGTATAPPNYSSDLCTDSCYLGGRELMPTCMGSACPAGSSAGTPCATSSCGGTGSTSDCSDGAWANTLQNSSSALWVSSPLASASTLTGAGGLSLFTQTVNAAASGTVTLCVEVYDVPPSGSASTLTDILAWPPVAIGGAGYVGQTDPSTGGNWPTSATQLSFTFNYSQQAVTVAAGHRIGVRVWFKENQSTPIDLIYDNPSYPAELQLNSQG